MSLFAVFSFWPVTIWSSQTIIIICHCFNYWIISKGYRIYSKHPGTIFGFQKDNIGRIKDNIGRIKDFKASGVILGRF